MPFAKLVQSHKTHWFVRPTHVMTSFFIFVWFVSSKLSTSFKSFALLRVIIYCPDYAINENVNRNNDHHRHHHHDHRRNDGRYEYEKDRFSFAIHTDASRLHVMARRCHQYNDKRDIVRTCHLHFRFFFDILHFSATATCSVRPSVFATSSCNGSVMHRLTHTHCLPQLSHQSYSVPWRSMSWTREHGITH